LHLYNDPSFVWWLFFLDFCIVKVKAKYCDQISQNLQQHIPKCMNL